MDLDQALRRLPRAHALALRLRDLGADAGLIADCLDLPVESVGPLLQVAEAKLANAGLRDTRLRLDDAPPVVVHHPPVPGSVGECRARPEEKSP